MPIYSIPGVKECRRTAAAATVCCLLANLENNYVGVRHYYVYNNNNIYKYDFYFFHFYTATDRTVAAVVDTCVCS